MLAIRMRETEPFSLVAGCGEKGASWVSQRDGAGMVLGLDRVIPKEVQENTHAQFVLGDVFSLPFKSGAVNQIYGDFIVNPLMDRKVAAKQILEDPEVLDTDYFPGLVRQWFVETLHGSHDSVRENIKEVSWLLKIVALREMWRVLANNGNLQLVDFERNTNLIMHYGPQIMNEDPNFISMKPLRISDDDYDRSESLTKLTRARRRIQKISLTKRHPSDD